MCVNILFFKMTVRVLNGFMSFLRPECTFLLYGLRIDSYLVRTILQVLEDWRRADCRFQIIIIDTILLNWFIRTSFRKLSRKMENIAYSKNSNFTYSQ